MTAVTAATPVTEPRSRGLFWALVPVGLLVASVVGVGSMAVIATRDPGFSLERDYYSRAVHWDREQDQRQENQRLGYQLTLESSDPAALIVRLHDRNGEELRGASVHAEAFANARAANVRQLAFTEGADGTYRARLDAPRPGLWEFRFRVDNAALHFTEVVRVDVSAGPAHP
jgi:nitrogen fixation protein FixH